MRPLDGMKRAAMKNMLEQHALRLKRGGFNSGFAHALRVRRGGIGQRSSWGHALRVRSSNMLNRGHALRIKRNPGDYKDDSEPEVIEEEGTLKLKRMGYGNGRDLFQQYYGNQFPYSWPLPARRLRSASFAHVLRV